MEGLGQLVVGFFRHWASWIPSGSRQCRLVVCTRQGAPLPLTSKARRGGSNFLGTLALQLEPT